MDFGIIRALYLCKVPGILGLTVSPTVHAPADKVIR